MVNYKQWVHTDTTSLRDLSSTVEEYITVVCERYDKLRQHHFIAKSQSNYLKKLKENLGSEEAIVLLNFAENFSFIVQDAVQGYHWDNSQATLHPFVIYYKSGDKLDSISICVISDCLRHDVPTVHTFVSKVMEYIKYILPFIKFVNTLVMGQPASTKIIKTSLIYVIINLTTVYAPSGTFSPCATGKVHATELGGL